MNLRNLFPGASHDGISREDQLAFARLAEAMILHEPLEVPLHRDNVVAISRAIQEGMLSAHVGAQQQFCGSIIVKLPEAGGAGEQAFDLTPPKFSFWGEKHMDATHLEYLKLARIISVVGFSDHGAIGFTPKLAWTGNSANLSMNCLGRAIFLGASCRRKGIPIEMAITADHPFIVSTLDEGLYADSVKITGYVAAIEHGKVYRPVPDDGQCAALAFVFDFDRCVLYSVLENMETLRQVSLGSDVALLPEYEGETRKAIIPYAEVLQAANWKRIQIALFPEFEATLSAYRREWNHEILRMRGYRDRQYVRLVFKRAAEAGQRACGKKDMSFDEAHKQLLRTLFDHAASVEAFRNGQPFSESFPQEAKTYFEAFKESMKDKPQDVREGCWDIMQNKIELGRIDI